MKRKIWLLLLYRLGQGRQERAKKQKEEKERRQHPQDPRDQLSGNANPIPMRKLSRT